MEIVYKDPHSGIMGEQVENKEATVSLSAIEAKTRKFDTCKKQNM